MSPTKPYSCHVGAPLEAAEGTASVGVEGASVVDETASAVDGTASAADGEVSEVAASVAAEEVAPMAAEGATTAVKKAMSVAAVEATAPKEECASGQFPLAALLNMEVPTRQLLLYLSPEDLIALEAVSPDTMDAIASRRYWKTVYTRYLQEDAVAQRIDSLWARSAKKTNVRTGPLARSLAPHYSLRSCALLRSLVRSLARSLRSLPRSWGSEFLMSHNDLVLSHSAP